MTARVSPTGVLALAALCLALPAASNGPRPPAPGSRPAADPQAQEFFEKKVRPVLVQHCFSCHSDRTPTPAGGLRLDQREFMTKGGGRGPAVRPGRPEESLLLRAVLHQSPAPKMPPAGPLPQEAIADLTTWIRNGASWGAAAGPGTATLAERRAHWAFQPLKPVRPAPVRNRAWVQTPVDAFLLARLERAGWKPAPPAPRSVWLRRVTFDLLGLPPTPQELREFQNDASPQAFEKVVDRLLASPHYGERWARHWLDLVRYAETDGHEFDFEKPGAYHYRDYVVRALNQDVPYDQFVREHLAGDLLAEPRRHPTQGFNESVLGTGFWWLGEGKHSPVDLREEEAERTDNQLDVFGKAFLGLSLGCARCHDHKFDPISTKDYYALFGYLRSSRYQLVDVADPEKARTAAAGLSRLREKLGRPLTATVSRQLLAALPGLHQRLRSALAAPAPEKAAGPVDAWRRSLEAPALPPDALWRPLALLRGKRGPEFAAARAGLADQAPSAPAARLLEGFDGSGYGAWSGTGLAFGEGPTRAGTLHLPGGAAPDGVIPAGVASSGSVSDRLHGTLRSASFSLPSPRLWIRAAGREGEIRLVIDGFQRIRNPIYGGLAVPVKQGPEFQWFSMDVSKWVGHLAYLELVDAGPGFLAVDSIWTGEGAGPATPNPRVAALAADPAVTSDTDLLAAYLDRFVEAVRLWGDGRLDSEPDAAAHYELLNWLLAQELVPPDRSEAALAEVGRKEQAIPSPDWAMALVDGTGVDEPVHIRGNYRTLGENAPRRYLELFCGPVQPTAGSTSGRLDLTERVLTASRPLLARVIVNRVWQHHFGEGLVRTPDDFGTRSDTPSHPELLEWLAGWLAGSEGRWSLKRLHRLILLSEAYRMDGTPDPAAAAADPRNRLLHHMPLRRLEGEAIRDAMLAVSGRLERTLGGPGVLPHLTPYMQGRGRPASSGPLDGNGRRSLYLGVRRNFLNPLFVAFDYPLPFNTMGRRSVSTAPAQALSLLNNPFVREQARLWAEAVLKGPAVGAVGRIGALYEAAFARAPSAAEYQAAVAFLEEHAPGRPDDVMAWTDLCHVLFNVKEFIFIR